MMKECVVCKTCKVQFDEPYTNCAPCRKVLALKAKQYRLIHGPEINAGRLGKRSKGSGNYKYRDRSKGSGNYKYRDRNKPMSDYPPKTCLHCDKIFQPSKSNWRVVMCCTKICYSRYKTNLDKIRRASLRKEITCRGCGVVSKPSHQLGKTCGKRECVDESRRKYRIDRDTVSRKKGGTRYEQVREYRKNYFKQRRETDPAFNLHHRISAGVRHSLRNKKGLRTFDLLDYTFDELYSHFELQFTDGMSWDNMSEWHIDHIRPVSSFNFDSTEHPDFKKCWALNNLQPLWAVDNMSKGDKWDGIINR